MSIKIHEKEYMTVAERVKEFRTNYPNYRMIDEIIDYGGTTITIKTSILDHEGNVVATGLAREDREDSKINETSYVENCETSAWGRALANLGIGITSEIASAEEVDNAIKQQDKLQEKGEPKIYEVPLDIKQYDLTAIKDDIARGKKQFAMYMRLVETFGQDKEELEKYIKETYGKKVMYLTPREYITLIQHVMDVNEPETFEYKDIPFGF